jgi:ABC-type nitrate/sulfonate/bicarbonate transport system substrate-binding protein
MRTAVLALLGFQSVVALRVSTSLQWLEYTPQPYAVDNFYKVQGDTVQIVSGGVANLVSDRNMDLAANAETQGLKAYAQNKKIRLIFIIVEVAYRLIGNREAGIEKLADFKGKRVGGIPGTSAGYFVTKFLGTAGLQPSDYRMVSGNACMKTPCGSGTYPQMMSSRQIDGFGMWEPAVELSAEQLGANAVIFKNASVYRETYSLYSTTDKLNDPASRAKIVQFVKALNQSTSVFLHQPDKVYSYASQKVGMDAAVAKKVWEDHVWGGTSMGDDLVEFLDIEDQYLAQQDRRQPAGRAAMAQFVDTSVIKEAMGLS